MKIWLKRLLVLFVLGAIFSAGAGESAAESDDMLNPDASDRLELELTSIRGNQELPTVLSIVPWKDPDLGDLSVRPADRLVDEVLAPVDREVFLRQTQYFDQLYADPESGD
jgi:hypothetical protein